MKLHDVLIAPPEVDLVFAKVLTPNDDTGKHGVVIPVPAYDQLPLWPVRDLEPTANHTRRLNVEGRKGQGVIRTWVNEKYYEFYPERRLTCLSNVGMSGKHQLIVVARRVDEPGLYEVHPVDLADPGCTELLQELGLNPTQFGQWTLVRPASVGPVSCDLGVDVICNAFDAHAGYPIEVPLPSSGQFRTKEVGMLAQRVAGKLGEDNYAGPDIAKTELKGMLAAEWRGHETPGDADLFLKEPVWTDGLTPTERVQQYGYIDAKQRHGLKVAVRAAVANAQGLELKPNHGLQRLDLLRHGEVIGHWELAALEACLKTKLTTTVYALATRTATTLAEYFTYHTLILAEAPSGAALLDLVGVGEVRVQLRMHHDVGSKTSIRNRGTQFRVNARSTHLLFGRLRVLRDYKQGLKSAT